ncbi:ATP synthase complex assembly protein atp12 [Cadophora gregata]|uniref:ATP synthase complex assembly protein atp12 n=1 Tax=Cadophora gregata TaxID=51156 RepID=UPI0026DCF992|nr:ATP synthase complex assembly protein atp12 [Cadophora gregata]KAK0110086.1 ATP synthase complex assembly protein atp12 [Cadophora gregata]KAK0110294.1 ATP synthase complex assembly protein atp12 [Cadophora gregata f. sp. sojae]
MKRITQSHLASLRLSSYSPSLRLSVFPIQQTTQRTRTQYISTTTAQPATVQPLTASGPPPKVPVPSAEHVDSRVARRRKQAELMKRGLDLKAIAGGTGGGSAKTKRFWKEVRVVEVDDGLQIHLDTRPLRRPSKAILTIPRSKPALATAIALEWDLLTSAHQALQHHLIPLTSLVSRALDIADEDASPSSNTPGPIRSGIANTLIRYLDTDSLLCWAPPASPDPPGYEDHASRKAEDLRSIQKRTAMPIISYLTERVWPGVEIVEVLDEGSILPRPQPGATRDVIMGWVVGLPAWELAGLERAVLAGKGMLGAARLVVEWSEGLGYLREGVEGVGSGEGQEKFGVEEAARAASLEVDWQTRMWGQVEDTHDVEHEDVRRQLGSVVLLVSGSGKGNGKQ